jgi:hypothetical protein
MKPFILMRIASVLTLIHAALHTVGGVFGAPPPAAAQVVQAMKTVFFPAMGVTRNYWEFHLGLGLAVTIFLTLEGIIFWQLGTLAKTNAKPLRPILATFLVGYFALAVNSWEFFFSGPVITEMLIALCLGLAIWKAQPSSSVSDTERIRDRVAS